MVRFHYTLDICGRDGARGQPPTSGDQGWGDGRVVCDVRWGGWGVHPFRLERPAAHGVGRQQVAALRRTGCGLVAAVRRGAVHLCARARAHSSGALGRNHMAVRCAAGQPGGGGGGGGGLLARMRVTPPPPGPCVNMGNYSFFAICSYWSKRPCSKLMLGGAQVLPA